MRFLIPAAAVALLAVPALAQTTTAPATTAPATTAPAGGAPATTAPAAAAPAPAMPAKPAKKTAPHHMTLQQHFDKVNVSHDGHLTKDQATAGKWSYITRNFDAIDKDKKGYVTMDDIHAFARAHHTVKKPAAPAPAPAGTSG
jgi:hypothetical protein